MKMWKTSSKRAAGRANKPIKNALLHSPNVGGRRIFHISYYFDMHCSRMLFYGIT